MVNEKNEQIGSMEKMLVHQQGLLHRAFSIFIFDSSGNMLLQKRSLNKYHGAGLWTNACCSHPAPGEEIYDAAERRLVEELGFSTDLKEIFSFIYHSHVENGLIEHEFDHVFVGQYEAPLQINSKEVADYKYLNMEKIKLEINNKPEMFTSWFKISFPQIEKWWLLNYIVKKV